MFDRKAYQREYMKRYWANRPGANSERVKKWQKENPEKRAAKSKRYYVSNIDRIRRETSARHRRYRSELALSYGRRSVAKGSSVLGSKDIPDALALAKLEVIRIKRLCKTVSTT